MANSSALPTSGASAPSSASVTASTSSSAVYSSQKMTVTLDILRIQQLQISKVFQDNSKEITSADFDDEGKLCITASADDSINLYDSIRGISQKLLFSKKYGAHPIRFTHSPTTILHGSTKRDNMIRYLSVTENKYLSYFRGHDGRVVSMAMSPADDTFISSAIDDSIIIWDFKAPSPQGRVYVGKGRPSVSFDPTGMIFASAIQQDNKVRLYDLRNFDKGPFTQFIIIDPYLSAYSYPRPGTQMPTWTGIKFSNDEKHILISTSGDQHYLIDAFSGELKRRLVGHVGLGDTINGYGGDDTCFTPNGAFVISGSQDGLINIWDINTSTVLQSDLRPCKQLEGHTKPTQVVQFNPRYMCMISACHEMVFWEPMPPGNSSDSNNIDAIT
ncbi:2281_t:CDS:2, partial [Ambispora leptoticha]